MGAPHPIKMPRTTALFIVAAIVASVATASLDESAQDRVLQSFGSKFDHAEASNLANEQSFARASESLAQMKSEGKDDTACEKVAQTAIKAIEDECKTLQKDVDEHAKDNTGCCNSGIDGVDQAKATHAKSKESHVKCTGELSSVKKEKVDFGKISYESLSENQCKATFFNSPAYQAQHKKVNEKKSTCSKIDGETAGFAKAILDAEEAACVARGKCQTDAEAKRDAAFNQAEGACHSTGNKASFTMAHHMLCVLQGKSLQGCNVPSLPQIKKTAMDKHECKMKCNIFESAEGTTCNHHGVKGFKVSSGCGKDKVGLLMLKSNKWDKNKVYHCPAGWYWPTTAQYFNRLKANGCESNNAKSSSEGHAYYNQCGLNGYHLPNGDNKYRFRFKDSKTTQAYQHAGNYIGYQHNKDLSTSEFAGVACLKN